MSKTDSKTPEGRAALLRACIRKEGCNALAGLRLYTEEPTDVMCRRLGLDPSLVRRCLGKRKGRRYNATRRALEVGLDLPPYAWDGILDELCAEEER